MPLFVHSLPIFSSMYETSKLDMSAISWLEYPFFLNANIFLTNWLETLSSSISVAGETCTGRFWALAKDSGILVFSECSENFSPILLPILIQSTNVIQDECYVLSPKTIKLWDSSWDCIVDEKFKNEFTLVYIAVKNTFLAYKYASHELKQNHTLINLIEKMKLLLLKMVFPLIVLDSFLVNSF